MEKHGPHLPLSTDMILAREIASRGAELQYAIVFPEFYLGQIFEARQLAELIRFLKTNDSATDLQLRFHKEAENPIRTEQ